MSGPTLSLAGTRFAPARLAERLRAAAVGQRLTISGIAPGALPWLAAFLPRAVGRPLAIVVAGAADAEVMAQDAAYYARAQGVPPPLLLPPLEPEPYLGIAPHLQTVVERTLTLFQAGAAAPVVLLPVEALLQRVPPPAQVAAMTMTIAVGDVLDRDLVVRDLLASGYRRQDMVGTVGDIAVRGGIVDVFSPAAGVPCRIELLGDRVESIRTFDPDSQRSEDEQLETTFLPLQPFRLGADADEKLRAFGASLPEELLPSLRAKREELRSRGTFPGIEYFLPVFVSPLATVLDHLPGFVLAVAEPEAVAQAIDRASAALAEAYAGAIERGHAFPSPEALALPAAQAHALVAGAALRLQALAGEDSDAAIALHTQPARRYEGRIKELVKDLAADSAEGLDAVVVLPTAGEAERVETMLSEYGLAYLEGSRSGEMWRDDLAPPPPGRGRLAVATGRLTQGFRSPLLQLSLYASPEVFGGAAAAPRRRRLRAASFGSDFRDLKVGDYVVHVDHGIARFLGLKTIEVSGSSAEFMVLSYSGEDRLYVPLDRLDLVQKYQGMEGFAPRLDTLGGAAWAKVKRKVKAELRSMADELLKLYASRRVLKGYAFSPDGLFQKEFEDAFSWVETPDQLTAIADVKADMESTRCMDRLLCGDVGYGKTEVAMRAAFKTVADGKQVAFLSPTTVLAFQHQRTLSERFKAFPLRIEMISRFRSKREIDQVLADTAAAKVDVLIGTHRLLSKDVRFRDLGLLIIDEEQRFGVSHKEKLKQMRQGIDVLTMSATPIPRTLQMSLAGLRDMSLIETPPRDRLAIETSVLRFGSQLIKEAIKREMERGGQIYFVHNRVQSIDAMCDTLRRIAPFARYTVAHGQMREGELEEAMLRFVDRGADVLVSSTIIENGLDLPNVNTIFINRAHRLGLSQLYQLRGRVGRSDRPAYAYLLVPPNVELTPVARRRLHAIQEFTELGSGFRIAALDLQIRGAGNVLGREQHGHIAAIGFDLYMDLLEQAVHELKGEEVAAPAIQLSLGVDVHVPETYVSDVNQRLMVYKKIAGSTSVADLDELSREIADRFGPPPPAVDNLLEAARLKIEAQALRLQAVERDGGLARLRVGPEARIDPEAVVAYCRGGKGRKLHPDGRIEFPVPPGSAALGPIREALRALAGPR